MNTGGVAATLSTRAGSLVGRELELGALAESVDGETQVVCVHGIAGIGKSELLSAFLDRRRAAGASVLALDCRTVEPTERGFLHGAGRFRELGELLQRVGDSAVPVVLALDHFEVFRLMDTWLRQVLAPALPAGVTMVLVGRERPVGPGWGSRGSGIFRWARWKRRMRN